MTDQKFGYINVLDYQSTQSAVIKVQDSWIVPLI